LVACTLEAAFTAYGDWDGKLEAFDVAVDTVFRSADSDFLTEVKGTGYGFLRS
jgi:hypothetical protein